MSEFIELRPDESQEPRELADYSVGWQIGPTVWLLAWLLLGGGLLFQSWGRHWSTPAVAKESTQELPGKKFASRAIKDIRTGMRVIAYNPELSGQEAIASNIDSKTWRNVRLRLKKPDGGELLMTLLRPVDWLQSRHGVVGKDIDVDLAELGVAGPATILAIEPCPVIEPGDSRVVTGIFHHSTANAIDLYVSSESAPIGTTANHPFWSETRREFVQAGSLQPGEALSTATNKSTLVMKIVARAGPESVFNLEVDGEHAYCVTDLGVVVHNGNEVYQVGLAKDLRKTPVVGTHVHHGPQSRQAEGLIGDFSVRNKVGHEPAIRLPIDEHAVVTAAQKARTAPASARDLLADDIRIMRQNTGAPNSSLQDLIRLSKERHPWDYLPLHRMDELP